MVTLAATTHLERPLYVTAPRGRARARSELHRLPLLSPTLLLSLPPPPLPPSPFIGRSAARTGGAVRWRFRKVARIRGEDQSVVPATPEPHRNLARIPAAHVPPRSGAQDTCRPRFGSRRFAFHDGWCPEASGLRSSSFAVSTFAFLLIHKVLFKNLNLMKLTFI